MNHQLITDPDAYYTGPQLKGEVINAAKPLEDVRYRLFNVGGIPEDQRVFWAEWWLENIEGIPRSEYKSATISDEGGLMVELWKKIEYVELKLGVVKELNSFKSWDELVDAEYVKECLKGFPEKK